MTDDRKTVFNRPDCPYGCGTPLASKLRWQATPCRGCGRPLYPVAAVVDDAGRQIWPPSSVPRPPTVPPDAESWYVVREEDADERTAVLRKIAQRGKKSEEGCLTVVLTFLGFAVMAVVDIVWRVVRAVLRR